MREDIDAYKNDIYNIMNKLKMTSIPVKPRRHIPNDVENLIYLETMEAGCWMHYVHSGDFVEEDQILGHITDLFGNIITTLLCRTDRCRSLHLPCSFSTQRYCTCSIWNY